MVTCVDQGGMWCVSFQSLFPNDREKETKHKKQKTKTLLMVLVLATLGLRQKLLFRDVPML